MIEAISGTLLKTLLLIEDDPHILGTVSEILAASGYRVLAHDNGREGVATALSEKPDLILCDVMMPGFSGFEVLQALQKEPEVRTIPFVFVSAKVTPSDIETGLRMGASDYLTKPFTMKQLLATVELMLKQ